MELRKVNQKLFVGSLLLGLCVALGALGAHGLEKTLSAKHLATFITGVHYQMIHSFGIILLGILTQIFNKEFKREFICFLVGIVFFSFNCYIYAISGVKIFAMLIPIGGVTFIVGWILLSLNFLKKS
ncbi:hypothetical protein A9Q84_02555 [Halobacteriovorax marinus]|uniref:DUF423 domain-containing protein n=1 Tax=Halobacteriovorax marinus TaxID=97084 RepID=A0A1Y5FCK8_9BACT|nr:hypothetical protein A9Q84_02555 [Halobacteriovorax marinus]